MLLWRKAGLKGISYKVSQFGGKRWQLGLPKRSHVNFEFSTHVIEDCHYTSTLANHFSDYITIIILLFRLLLCRFWARQVLFFGDLIRVDNIHTWELHVSAWSNSYWAIQQGSWGCNCTPRERYDMFLRTQQDPEQQERWNGPGVGVQCLDMNFVH